VERGKEVEEVKEAEGVRREEGKADASPAGRDQHDTGYCMGHPRSLSPRPGRGWNEAHALCPRVYTLGYRLPPRRGCNKQMLLPQGGIHMTAGSRIVIARTPAGETAALRKKRWKNDKSQSRTPKEKQKQILRPRPGRGLRMTPAARGAHFLRVTMMVVTSNDPFQGKPI
jgi:hypothetical protein